MVTDDAGIAPDKWSEDLSGARLPFEEQKGTTVKALKISLDFLAGSLWRDEFINGKAQTGIPTIDNDEALQAFNDQICELYSSCYEFDLYDQPCWFNEEKEKADKPRMLELLGKLNARIAELTLSWTTRKHPVSKRCSQRNNQTSPRPVSYSERGPSHHSSVRSDKCSDDLSYDARRDCQAPWARTTRFAFADLLTCSW